MGDRHIYDIIEQFLPSHILGSMNIAKVLTKQKGYEIIVDALEKYFSEMGIKSQPQAEPKYFLINKAALPEKDGFYCHNRKVKIKGLKFINHP